LMLSLLLIALAFSAVCADDATAVADPVEYRVFATKRDTNENSISVAGAKLEVTKTGDFSGNAALDIAGFKFVAGGYANPENKTNPQVAMGFSFLSATASVDWTPSPTGGSFLYSYVGAWAEMVVGYSIIALYKERDGQPGF